MKTIYLAAKFSRRAELESYLPFFEGLGLTSVASWVTGSEDGMSREDIAVMDLEDVRKAGGLVIFTHERGEPQPGGGRFVEMGYALALGKEVHVIGPEENVFTATPGVRIYQDLEHFALEQKLK